MGCWELRGKVDICYVAPDGKLPAAETSRCLKNLPLRTVEVPVCPARPLVRARISKLTFRFATRNCYQRRGACRRDSENRSQLLNFQPSPDSSRADPCVSPLLAPAPARPIPPRDAPALDLRAHPAFCIASPRPLFRHHFPPVGVGLLDGPDELLGRGGVGEVLPLVGLGGLLGDLRQVRLGQADLSKRDRQAD